MADRSRAGGLWRRAGPESEPAPAPAPEAAAEPLALPEGFDEHAYLVAHPDVREAVAAGLFASGAAHYAEFGHKEGRALDLRVARGPAQLDAEIDRLRALMDRSFSQWMRARATFTYYEDVAALPPDPLSDAYRDAQLALYCEISGRPAYEPWTAEPVAIDVASGGDPSPFPFSSGDGELIGGHLVAMGHIMQALWQSKPGTRHTLLEYGCGSGFTTMFLAASGFRVTAVDINADALAVVDMMSDSRKLGIRTHCGEFGDVPVEGERYDVIFFYEAFHHCLDFVPVLRRLREHLADDGIMMFAGEAIYTTFQKPWGLRVDGASLWEIRTRGWLELGFREDFFIGVLAQTGWSCDKLRFAGSPDIYVARKAALPAD